MPNIQLSRGATGRELTDVLRTVADEIGFEYSDFGEDISIGRQFPEYVPEHLKFAFDVTPSLEFRFDRIEPERMYATLQVQTRIGTMTMQPTNFEGEEVKYKSHYDRFVELVKQHLL